MPKSFDNLGITQKPCINTVLKCVWCACVDEWWEYYNHINKYNSDISDGPTYALLSIENFKGILIILWMYI